MYKSFVSDSVDEMIKKLEEYESNPIAGKEYFCQEMMTSLLVSANLIRETDALITELIIAAGTDK